ncbi:MAG: AIPR family protein [Roseiarcus sp.]
MDEFAREHGLDALDEAKQFEHFASYITVRRQYSETFDSSDIVTGDGETGIDGVAIIVNGSLITDIEALSELADHTSALDVIFVFVQAVRSASFDGAKIGNFAYGVRSFFEATPAEVVNNDSIKEAAAIKTAIYDRSSKFRRGNPLCCLYYVTTGIWTGDQNLEARRLTAISDLQTTNLFKEAKFFPVGASDIQRLYRQTKHAISRNFTFSNKSVVPEVQGVSQAYLGTLTARELLRILRDEDGDLIGNLFYDNVRDWQDYNEVNSEIRETLRSGIKDRFVLMNNGVTIIARSLTPTGNHFVIEDFQVVNGCQTCHVLFDEADNIDDSVVIPLRLIATQDEAVIHSIVRATNRQTEVKEEQFFAVTEFAKTLEEFFKTFQDSHKLFYERRSCQYDNLPIEKTRIVTPANLIRAFAAMFLDEPHRTTRNYAALREKVGREIFVHGHKLQPYYLAAWTLYRLEYFFRSGRLEAKYKPARYHILLAVRILANPATPPRMNSHDMEDYCNALMTSFWDVNPLDDLLTRAASAVDQVAAGNFHRDNIRTEPFTQQIIAYCQDVAAAS